MQLGLRVRRAEAQWLRQSARENNRSMAVELTILAREAMAREAAAKKRKAKAP